MNVSMFSKFRVYTSLILLSFLLPSCAPAFPSPTSTPVQPINTAPVLTATESPTQIPIPEEELHLEPVGDMWAFPGPEHYEGDVLTFAIRAPADFDQSVPVSMALDGRKPTAVLETFYLIKEVVLRSALDTTNLTGHHTIRFTTPDGKLDETYSFEVLPAEERPVNERNAEWQIHESDCCIFHYLSATAAARDIDFIAEHFQQGADEYKETMKAEIDSKMEIYILDRIFGNGGFGGNGQLAISYTDRYYGPTLGGEGLETLARHEFSHAASISPENSDNIVDFNYEGLAVYVAGGHYKPEPLAQRGAALYDLGRSAPVNEIIPQHELSYLHAALILTYITDTYGEEKLWEFLTADPDPSDEQLLPLEDAIRLTFGVSLEEFDRGFQSWLESNDPGKQLDDLRLTVELQDARRKYQEIYSPDPMFLRLEIELRAVTRPDYLPVVMRESHAPANVAIELMIANANEAIGAGAYSEAEQLIRSIKEVVATGDFDDPLAKEYQDIVLAAAREGYEVVHVELQGDHAEARVTVEPPNLVNMKFQKVNGTWQIQS